MQRFELFIRSIPVGHTLSEWKCETEHYIHLWLFRLFPSTRYPHPSHVQIFFSPFLLLLGLFYSPHTFCTQFHIFCRVPLLSGVSIKITQTQQALAIHSRIMEQLGIKVFIEEHAKTDVKKCSKVNMFKQKIMGKNAIESSPISTLICFDTVALSALPHSFSQYFTNHSIHGDLIVCCTMMCFIFSK